MKKLKSTHLSFLDLIDYVCINFNLIAPLFDDSDPQCVAGKSAAKLFYELSVYVEVG